MKKLSLLLALCLLLLALPACGNKKPEGLLSQDEIAKYESLYLTGNDSLLKDLNLSEADVDTQAEGYENLRSGGVIPLKDARAIAGTDYQVLLMTAVTQPEGLYGVQFRVQLRDADQAKKVLNAVYPLILERHGEPDTYSTEKQLSQQLDAPASGFDTWALGGVTELNVRLTNYEEAANFSPDWEYRFGLELEYRVPSIVDGQRLSGEEVLDMVRKAQQ